MILDEEFLRSHGLLLRPYRGTLESEAVSTSYAYDREHRLVYIPNDAGGDAQALVRAIRRSLMFDYAWIAGPETLVVRSYGHRRVCRIGPKHTWNESQRETISRALGSRRLYLLFEDTETSSLLADRIIRLLDGAVPVTGSVPDRQSTMITMLEQLCMSLRPVVPGHTPEESPDAKTVNGTGQWEGESDKNCARVLTPVDNRHEDPLLSVRRLLTGRWCIDPYVDMPSAVSPYIIETIHERMPSLSDERTEQRGGRDRNRRAHHRIGCFYTPEQVAHWIVSRTLQGWIRDRLNIDVYAPDSVLNMDQDVRERLYSLVRSVRVLDPACGAGVFLRTAADWLYNIATILSVEQGATSARRIVNSSLYGVDIQPSAVCACTAVLRLWAMMYGCTREEAQDLRPHVCVGNTLTHEFSMSDSRESDVKPGRFDIVVGNPPYGNIIPVDVKRTIRRTCPEVNGGRTGTWSASAHFVVRARQMAERGGWMGLLIPNSVMRVRQFQKTRQFLLDHTTIHEIADEGAPFPHITLEMVSVIARADSGDTTVPVIVTSRRPYLPESITIPREALRRESMFFLYFDEIIRQIMRRGMVAQLRASRGHDPSKEHVRDTRDGEFQVPYVGSGKGVRHFSLDQTRFKYVDDSFRHQRVLLKSFENELLIATKNLPYPRCATKPRGVIHGGGTVSLVPTQRGTDLAAMGLILNSSVMRYLCVRYYTNYSELTTCMNTGIVEYLPIVYPRDTRCAAALFRLISSLRQSGDRGALAAGLQDLADSVVYELYLTDESRLLDTVADVMRDSAGLTTLALGERLLVEPEVRRHMQEVRDIPLVTRIERAPRMENLARTSMLK
ncbi:MAG: N-6 DNA methylase [Candidatus Thorarchaeota archaeon]